ncbi:MAG: adenosylcobinamide-GDP ribazoletransferase [Actinomycetota bacterium]|nr:adenosylcobinamide-GDP ribazoletransferase [Actinomycetota bacterium]
MRAALSFLTCLGGPVPPSPRALPWFSVVGAGLGLALGGSWWIAERIWPPLLAAAVVVAVDLALTGMLHLDGLADSADGLLAHGLDRVRRLEVMAEPATGAFALATVVVVLVARVAALAALAPAPLLLGALWATSRAAMALVVRTQPYARAGGLATSFGGSSDHGSSDQDKPERSAGSVVATVVVPPLALVILAASVSSLTGGIRGGHVLVAVVAATLAAVGVVRLARCRLGGYTGDVLGAAGMLAETAGLVVAAARW